MQCLAISDAGIIILDGFASSDRANDGFGDGISQYRTPSPVAYRGGHTSAIKGVETPLDRDERCQSSDDAMDASRETNTSKDSASLRGGIVGKE